MAQFFALDSTLGIDQSSTSTGSQFLVSGPRNNGIFDGNNFQFATATLPGVGHGWFEGSGFQTNFSGGQYVPIGGTVSSINVDFSGGNTQDVSIGLINVSLVALFNASWAQFQALVFAGSDRFVGSYHNDKLSGEAGNDLMFGGFGDKLIPFNPNDPDPNNYNPEAGFTVAPGSFVDDGADILAGGSGRDTLDGGTNSDILYGGTQGDVLHGGGTGKDTLYGGSDNDRLFGGSDVDLMQGDKGNDTQTGGAGLDRFVFNAGWGRDVIADFSANDGEDIVLNIGALGFADMVQNHLQTDVGSGFAKIVYGVNTIILNGYHVADFGGGGPLGAADFVFS